MHSMPITPLDNGPTDQADLCINFDDMHHIGLGDSGTHHAPDDGFDEMFGTARAGSPSSGETFCATDLTPTTMQGVDDVHDFFKATAAGENVDGVVMKDQGHIRSAEDFLDGTDMALAPDLENDRSLQLA